MVSSAESFPVMRLVTAAALVPPVAMLLCGCVSTQQKAAWLHVVNGRTLASQSSTIVRRAGRQTRVQKVAVVRDGGRLAFAVTIHSLASHPLNDLPVSIGVRTPGHAPVYLNRAANLAYFDTHLAVIEPGATITWVLATQTHTVPAGRPFALVGSEPRTPLTVAHTVPLVSATATGSGDRLRVTVTNHSSISQTPLLLYAVATRRGHVSAAGAATVAHLAGGHRSTANLSLVGNRRGSHLTLEAFPTLF